MGRIEASPSPLLGGGVPAVAAPLDRPVGAVVRWAFYAWMIALPFNVVTLPWLPIEFQGTLSVPRIAGVVLLLAFVLDTRLWPWKLPPAFLPFAAFFGAFTLSMLRNDFTNFGFVFQQIQLFLLFVICYNLFLSPQITRNALFCYALSCGISSMMMLTGISTDVSTIEEQGGRLSAFQSDPNLYSKLLVVGTLVAIGLAHVRTEKRAVLLPVLWGTALVTIAAIAQSGSRGMTLALAVGLATFIFRKGTLWTRFRTLWALAIIAGVALWTARHTEVLAERWHETWDLGRVSGRDEIFKESLGMVANKPWIGWGPAATRELANRLQERAEVRSTHNLLLAVLTYTGLAGFIPFVCGGAIVLWHCWRARNGVENVLPLAIFMALFVAEMSSGGMPEKLHWTFIAYQLAAGQLACWAARPSQAASRSPLPTPLVYARRP